MGMLSKRYHPFGDWSGFQKNRKEVVSFYGEKIEELKKFPKINLHYQKDKKIEIEGYEKTSSYNGTQVFSNFNQDFFSLKGKKWSEIREARNHYNKKIRIEDSIPVYYAINFLERWKETYGKKYGWQQHTGYDINFFNKFYKEEESELWGLSFWLGDKFVGYSVVSRYLPPNGTQNCFNYIIRKADNRYRNLCLYIDYKTFEWIWEEKRNDFWINWGASSGGVLKYKKKFPVYLEDKLWFNKYKREDYV